MHRTSKIVPLNPTLFLPSYLYYKWRLSQSLSPASAIARGRFASHCYCCCFVPIFQLFSGHWHVRKWLCICGTKCFWCRGGLGSESESPFRMLPVVFSPRSGVLNPYQVIALDIRWFSFPKRWTGHKQYGGSIDEVGHWGLCNMLKWWWGQLEFCWLIYWWMLMTIYEKKWMSRTWLSVLGYWGFIPKKHQTHYSNTNPIIFRLFDWPWSNRCWRQAGIHKDAAAGDSAKAGEWCYKDHRCNMVQCVKFVPRMEKDHNSWHQRDPNSICICILYCF